MPPDTRGPAVPVPGFAACAACADGNPAGCDDAGVASLADFVAGARRLFVLSGAGCSTDSGIPDYRDARGDWKRAPPVTYQAFTGEAATRRRYWARSLAGWPLVGRARPNAAHAALAELERRGKIGMLLTQNVDRLHQAAGSRAVIDLHGRLDLVACLGCARRMPREHLQSLLLATNPGWSTEGAMAAPDGDADLPDVDYARFRVPDCPHCGGMLKPDVVFFGEAVPRERVETAMRHLTQCDAMLVAGSSLMVYSGLRFVRRAVELGLPVAAVNLGRTRADELLSLKVLASCGDALSHVAAAAATGAG